MKKYVWMFIFLILIITVAIFLFNKNNNNNQEDSYTAEKTSITQKNIDVQDTNLEEKQIQEPESTDNTNQEEKISSFSTRLPKDTKARYSNIELACKTLNGTIVKSGDTFSLWEVLGCPTKAKGYRRAKAFTSGGKVIQSYGGGICQVSTTIYNAVLEVDGLKIKERHEHSRDVVYVEDGKDAAVSYDTADLKFKNTLEYDVKIEAKVKDNRVKIKLIRI